MSPRLSRLDRAIGVVPWILGALLGAVALHLLAVLAMPALAPNSAFRALALPLQPGEKELVARAAAESGGPRFADPFAALAICRFDLARGPLRLRARADGDHPTSVSVRLSDGAVIYSTNDRQTPHGRFNIRIVTQAQADAEDAAPDTGAAADNPDQASADKDADDLLRLVSPGARGFAVYRVLGLREGDYEAAAAARGAFECAVEKPAP
ncbi:hypothetical protein [Rhodoblastus sp.]|uniref:hypothetical protein n=1 Tax=Rhodoblastus sp. TaxID=1962975 RepID=UPI0035AF73B5